MGNGYRLHTVLWENAVTNALGAIRINSGTNTELQKNIRNAPTVEQRWSEARCEAQTLLSGGGRYGALRAAGGISVRICRGEADRRAGFPHYIRMPDGYFVPGNHLEVCQ